MTGMVGWRAADAVAGVMDNAKERPQVGNFAGVIDLVVTLIGASAVFAQLQNTLSRAGAFNPKPAQQSVRGCASARTPLRCWWVSRS
jgi:membrane protein